MDLNIPLLPVELISYVIEYAHEDRETIRACSLVCKTWHPIAHSILFERIAIPIPTLHPVSVETIDNKVSPVISRADYVQSLCLEAPLWMASYGEWHEIPLTAFMALVHLFPNLKELELRYVQLYPDRSLSAFQSKTPLEPNNSVRTVRIDSTSVVQKHPFMLQNSFCWLVPLNIYSTVMPTAMNQCPSMPLA